MREENLEGSHGEGGRVCFCKVRRGRKGEKSEFGTYKKRIKPFYLSFCSKFIILRICELLIKPHDFRASWSIDHKNYFNFFYNY